MLSLLMLESVIFGVFTGVMFFNQMWAVGTDETVCLCVSFINVTKVYEIYTLISDHAVFRVQFPVKLLIAFRTLTDFVGRAPDGAFCL